MEENETRTHRLDITDREKAYLTGVIHVQSFDERQVTVETELGLLTIIGEEFHITSLDLDKGEMMIEGIIASLEYSAPDKVRTKDKGKSFLQRLFR